MSKGAIASKNVWLHQTNARSVGHSAWLSMIICHCGALARRRIAVALPDLAGCPPRYRPVHGAKIAAEAAVIGALTAPESELEDIDPSLILMATVPGFTSDNDWRLAGLTVVAHKEGKDIILFWDDIELTAFRERVAAYTMSPPEKSL